MMLKTPFVYHFLADQVFGAACTALLDRIDEGGEVSRAADASTQFGLLNNDALIVVLMQRHALIHLAGNDADFDRVPGITRYAPV